MSGLTIQQWERDFRRRAKADKLALLRDSLRTLQIRARPQLMLEGTIQMVRACAAYAAMDGQPYASFLAMQTYDPAESPTAVYTITFSLYRKGFARVLVGRDLRELDLADLYSHPWQKYKLCGYDRFWIARTSRKTLSRRDLAKLERVVIEDLLCDYSEDQVDLWFDDNHTEGTLSVSVQDREGADVVDFLRACRIAKALEAQQRL